MDRRAWRATVHGVTRVGHHLATKPPPPAQFQEWLKEETVCLRGDETQARFVFSEAV